MTSQTEAPPTSPDEARHNAGASPVANDPQHDIDATKTIVWLLISAVLVLFLMWVMTQLYYHLIAVERYNKIDNVAPVDLMKLRKQEDLELNGQHQKTGNMSIDNAMHQMVEKATEDAKKKGK